jgi:Zn finger protein HypA/HybF involved in hydrogenase expression
VHESRLLADVVRRAVAAAAGTTGRIEQVRLAVAADGRVHPDAAQRGFAARAEGTPAAGAIVLVEQAADVPPDAVLLVSVTIVD